MRVVVALGGNALLQRGQKPDAEVQLENVRTAMRACADIVRDGHELVLTHGNGPQVGMLAVQSANDPSLSKPYPFDVIGAFTDGMIGYMLAQEMENEVRRPTATLLTRTLVTASDPAFANPTKFVGVVYDEATAKKLAAANNWVVKPDGDYWRRVVPSPKPIKIVEIKTVRLLVEQGIIVIAAGGGGIPVIRGESGDFIGSEAVVDKDLTAEVLAEQLEADVLVLLTDVPNVMVNYGTPQAEAIRIATPAKLRSYSFPAGSMGPKVEAIARFAEYTGCMGAIGNLADAAKIIRGEAGTICTPTGQYVF